MEKEENATPVQIRLKVEGFRAINKVDIIIDGTSVVADKVKLEYF